MRVAAEDWVCDLSNRNGDTSAKASLLCLVTLGLPRREDAVDAELHLVHRGGFKDLDHYEVIMRAKK